MRFIRLYILLAAVTVAVALHAQTDPLFSQYYEVQNFYNPAAIGLTDQLRIRAGGRMQWVGIKNAPVSFAGVADMPVKIGSKRIGVGLMIEQESQGLYKTLNLNLQGGYKFRKFGGEWTAAFGVGIYDQSFKGSEVYIPEGDDYHQPSDEGLPETDIHGTTVDLSLGLYYKHPKFYAGLSMTHLNSPTVNMTAESGGSEGIEKKYTFTARRSLYFVAGGNIPLKNTLLEILPSAIVYSDFTFTGAEITARARYRKFISFGVGYRWNDAVTATLAAEVKNFYIGYAYGYSTSAIHKASSGSHEIFLGYSLKLNLGEKNRHKHKSVRLM